MFTSNILIHTSGKSFQLINVIYVCLSRATGQQEVGKTNQENFPVIGGTDLVANHYLEFFFPVLLSYLSYS